jgi:anti-sigma regulatory factor (Ser/Thr protein kinase)
MTVPPMSRRAGVVPGSRSAWDRKPSSGAGPAPGEKRPAAWTSSHLYQSHLVLGALPGAVPCARLHARLVLAEWGLKALADTVELIVSELVTNAVRASAALPERQHSLSTVQLRLSADHERTLVQVWDADHQLPMPQQPDPEAEHGRGLLLVESLSDAWGAYRPQRSIGKIVWATLH